MDQAGLIAAVRMALGGLAVKAARGRREVFREIPRQVRSGTQPPIAGSGARMEYDRNQGNPRYRQPRSQREGEMGIVYGPLGPGNAWDNYNRRALRYCVDCHRDSLTPMGQPPREVPLGQPRRDSAVLGPRTKAEWGTREDVLSYYEQVRRELMKPENRIANPRWKQDVGGVDAATAALRRDLSKPGNQAALNETLRRQQRAATQRYNQGRREELQLNLNDALQRAKDALGIKAAGMTGSERVRGKPPSAEMWLVPRPPLPAGAPPPYRHPRLAPLRPEQALPPRLRVRREPNLLSPGPRPALVPSNPPPPLRPPQKPWGDLVRDRARDLYSGVLERLDLPAGLEELLTPEPYWRYLERLAPALPPSLRDPHWQLGSRPARRLLAMKASGMTGSERTRGRYYPLPPDRTTGRHPMTVGAEREIDRWLEMAPPEHRLPLQGTLIGMQQQIGYVPPARSGMRIHAGTTTYRIQRGEPDLLDRVNARLGYLRARAAWQQGRGPRPLGVGEEWMRQR